MSREAFADVLGGVMDEPQLRSSYAYELGIDLTATEPRAATLAYTDSLLATTAHGGIGLTCATMTPCMRLYAHRGTSLAPPAENDYAQWILTYADPAHARDYGGSLASNPRKRDRTRSCLSWAIGPVLAEGMSAAAEVTYEGVCFTVK